MTTIFAKTLMIATAIAALPVLAEENIHLTADENGVVTYTFELEDGEDINLANLPEGVTVTVSEKEYPDFITTINGTEGRSVTYENFSGDKDLDFTNTKESAYVEMRKTDDLGELLPGAQLLVTGKTAAGRWIEPILFTTTDEVYACGLKPGEYTLSELTAPSGYGYAESINFTVEEDLTVSINNETKSFITMVDQPSNVIPLAGAKGNMMVYVLSGLYVVAGLIVGKLKLFRI